MKSLHEMFQSLQTPAPAPSGAQLAGLFESLETRFGTQARSAFEEILTGLNLPAEHPLALAGRDIAALIDGDVHAGGHENPYHDHNHMLEVAVSTALLLAIHVQKKYDPAFTPEQQLLAVVAAFGHDLGHNGRGNRDAKVYVPLLTEQHALDLAEPIIRKHYAASGRNDFKQAFAEYSGLIVSTDIAGGKEAPGTYLSLVSKAHRGLRHDAGAHVPEPFRDYIDYMAARPALTELACIIQDADLLPTLSVSPLFTANLQVRLAEEIPALKNAAGDIDWSGTVRFHETQAAPKSLAGQNFMASHEIIKAYAREQDRLQRLTGSTRTLSSC